MPTIAASNASGVFTHVLTGSASFVIEYGDGLNKLSIYNGSAVTGTVTGDLVINGVTSNAIDIPQYATVTIAAPNAKVLTGVTITAPASCILTIVGGN
jgi:hypothetical protein